MASRAAKRSGTLPTFQARHGLELDAEVARRPQNTCTLRADFREGRGARAGKRSYSCLWQLKVYIKFNCLDHALFDTGSPPCGGVLLDRYKLLRYAPQQ